jgi:hypothetical protein
MLHPVRSCQRLALAVALLLGQLHAPPATSATDSPPETAAELLERAFELRYDLDLVQSLTIEVHYQDTLVSRQQIEIAGKRIDGRYYVLGRYRRPTELRGTAVLMIEAEDRGDDHFVFLPSLQRVRRVSSAQRSDSFFGTDLSYEDIARLRADSFDLTLAEPTEIDGEAVAVIVAYPRGSAGYERMEFLVARRDAAILETRHYQRGSDEPMKITRFPRAHIREIDGRLIPTAIVVTTPRRGTRTEIRTERLSVNPPLDASLFTAAALESTRAIPGLTP